MNYIVYQCVSSSCPDDIKFEDDFFSLMAMNYELSKYGSFFYDFRTSIHRSWSGFHGCINLLFSIVSMKL
jgi:hypothetical protein